MSNKQIEVHDKIWQEALSIEKFVSKVILFDNVLIESEYNLEDSYKILGNKKNYSFLLDEDYVKQNRIYISDRLYGLYFTYRAILLRVYILYYKGKKKGNIKRFTNDYGVKQHLRTQLSDSAIKKIFSKKMGILSDINNLFKNMILKEIRKERKNIKKGDDPYGINITAGKNVVLGNDNTVGDNKIKDIDIKSKSWQDNILLYSVVTTIVSIIIRVITNYMI